VTTQAKSEVVRNGPRGGLLGLAALIVAWPLVPSEAVAMGGGVLLILWTLTLTLIAAIVGWRRGERGMLCSPVDLLLGAFFLLFVVSGIQAIAGGHGRSILNVVWQWLAMGLLWLLVREWLRSAVVRRATIVVLLAMAAGLSSLGFYQVLVTMPRDRAAFERDPEGSLQAAGIVAPVGSPLRAQYEDRLRSREPLATFALTNSLAGFLVPWLLVATLFIVAPEMSATSGGTQSFTTRIRAGALILVVVIGACLLITKSRSGYVATLVGMSGIAGWLLGAPWSGWFSVRQSRDVGARDDASHPQREAVISRGQLAIALSVAAMLLVLLVGVMVRFGLLDIQVLTEARKSLGYRGEYWIATWAMIQDHPWWGCGPGNFQDFYAAYKLPQASEMIADPHNFLLEIAALAGLPAAIVWLVTLATYSWQVLRGHPEREASATPATRGQEQVQPLLARSRATKSAGTVASGAVAAAARVAAAERWLIYGGAVGGLPLAYLAALLMGMTVDEGVWLVGLPAAGLVVWLFDPWVRAGEVPRRLLILPLLALGIHLLAAGGIGFAGVSLTWWVLGALLLSSRELPAAGSNLSSTSPRETALSWFAAPRLAWGVLGGVTAILLAIFTLTMYRPLLTGRVALERGDQAWLSGQAAEAGAWYLAAQAEDRWNAEPWVRLAGWHQRAWNDARREQDWSDLLAAAAQVDRLHGRSQQVCSEMSSMFRGAYRATDRREALDQAIYWAERAVGNFPNGALVHARLAQLYHWRGDHQLARSEAETALRLDELNPHQEQKLARQPDTPDLQSLVGENRLN
jgi:hypothetical protein